MKCSEANEFDEDEVENENFIEGLNLEPKLKLST